MRHPTLALAVAAGLAVGPPALAAPALPTSYAFGPPSLVTYDLVHRLHAVRGTTSALEGVVSLVDDRLVTPLTLKLPLRTFQSGNANRDANAYLALGVLRHPLATLEVQRFAESGRTRDGAALRIAGTAHGTLSVRGVAQPIAIPLRAALAGGTLTVDATFPVSLTAHGIPRPALMFIPVEDAVTVTVHGVARQGVN